MGIGYEDDRRGDKPVEGLPFGSRRVRVRMEKIRGFLPLTRILNVLYKIDDRKGVIKYLGTSRRPVQITSSATYVPKIFSKINIIPDNFP